MAELQGIPSYVTSRFTRTEPTKFVAELSDFGPGRFGPLGSHIYDDACDYGFWLISQWTRKKVLMVLVAEERDCEGNLQYWTYQTAYPTRDPSLTVVIFND